MQDGAYVGLPGNEGDCAGNEALVDHHEDDPGDQQWQHQRGRHHQGATGDWDTDEERQSNARRGHRDHDDGREVRTVYILMATDVSS